MKILRVEVHNVKRIKDLVLDLQGHHLFLIGGNNRAGKSSALDAIEYAITGKKAIPEQPLRKGTDGGLIRLHLEGDKDLHQSGLVVERAFLPGGKTEMRLMSDDGFQAPQPQSILNDLYERAGFDPLAFTRMKPTDQVAELQKITGVTLGDLDIKRENKYRERAQVNVRAKSLKIKADDMPAYEAPEEPVSISELLNEMTEATTSNSRISAAQAELKRKESATAKVTEAIEAQKVRIEEIRKAAIAAEDLLRSMVAEWTEKQGQLDAAKAGVEAMTPVDVAPIEQRLREAESTNEKVRANKAKAKAQAEAAAEAANAKALTDEIEAIDKEKAKRMSEGKWPVEGLGFNDKGVTLNGLPFEQASSAEQLQVSVAMGMSMNPKLRLMVIRDGSLLDNDTLSDLDVLVKENDYQLLVEVVTRSDEDEGRCMVVIEEGAAKGIKEKEAVPAGP